ncbi:hypothetical protein [Paenibacillus gansuensis]|uniref:Amino acid transporter n=1 Tax=Paenibacillus gansuensis TaxID=306542 RepID=A0ABW5PII7_9BACL
MEPNFGNTPNPLNEETAKARQDEVERQIQNGTAPTLFMKFMKLIVSIAVLVVLYFVLVKFV